ncbi:MAG: hypothetical protein ACU0DI_04455 [Paracoccaceae bacterium]
MNIPLNDAIWSRLYGPYGLENVGEILAGLNEQWDAEVAKDLFWEKLHHQDDLFPVTNAALPWLFAIAQKEESASPDIAYFISHALRCAVEPREFWQFGSDCTDAKFNGLPVSVAANAFYWIGKDRRLGANDIPVLSDLESWFDRTKAELGRFCLSVAAKVSDPDAGCLLVGPSALEGAFQLAYAVEIAGWDEAVINCIACGRPHDILWEGDRPKYTAHRDDGVPGSQFEPKKPTPEILAVEKATALKLAQDMDVVHPKISTFLRQYAIWSCCA